jgi:hypothetical protein
MSYVAHELGALVQHSPNDARQAIVAAFRSTGGSKIETTRVLGCTMNTLYRWIARLELNGVLENVRRELEKAGKLATIPLPRTAFTAATAKRCALKRWKKRGPSGRKAAKRRVDPS